MKEKTLEGFFKIIHQSVQTDTLTYISTIIKAKNKEEALDKFLKGPWLHKHYSYLSPPKLEDVYPITYY